MPANTWLHRNSRCSHSFSSRFMDPGARASYGNGVMEWWVGKTATRLSSNTPALQYSSTSSFRSALAGKDAGAPRAFKQNKSEIDTQEPRPIIGDVECLLRTTSRML